MRAFLKTAVLAAGILGGAAAASAQTVANTEITSTATLDYRGKDSATTPTAQTSFRVDRVVNFTVASARAAGIQSGALDPSGPAATVAQPGGSVDLTYTITNTGNETLRFAFYQLNPLTYPAQATGIDNVDFVASVTTTVSTVSGGGQSISVNTGATSTNYANTASASALQVDVGVGATLVITAPVTVPEGAAFNTEGIHALAVQAVQPDTFADGTENEDASVGSVWTADASNTVGTTETVFADNELFGVAAINNAFNEVANNAVVVAVSELGVENAGLTVGKTITGLAQDGTDCGNLSVGLGNEDPAEFYLPGACVEYTISIKPTTDETTVNDISITEAWNNADVSFEGIEVAGDFAVVNTGSPESGAATAIAVDDTGSGTLTLEQADVEYSCAALNSCTLDVSGMRISGTDNGSGVIAEVGTIRVRYRIRD